MGVHAGTELVPMTGLTLERGFPSVLGAPIALGPWVTPLAIECLRAIADGCDTTGIVSRRMNDLGLYAWGDPDLPIDRALCALDMHRLAKRPNDLYAGRWKLYAAGRKLLERMAVTP